MSKGAYFANQWGLAIKEAAREDDYLHRDQWPTQFFGFSIPEENIHSINYFRQHPNMGHLICGVSAWQGIKRHQAGAELIDFRLFNTDAPLANDLNSVSFENGYKTEVIEPMKRHRITYRDDYRQNSFDIEYTAVAPAVSLVHSGHFEQTMRTQGEVVLRGKRFDVDGFNIRNRTWLEARDEAWVSVPATAWMACVIDENLSFCVNAIDHPDLDPFWKPYFDVPEDRLLLGGWLYRDGEVCGIKSIRKITHYDEEWLYPTSFAFTMYDDRDRRYDVKGKITAIMPYPMYMNLDALMCLSDIECNGRKGQCDFQDLRWTDLRYAYERGDASRKFQMAGK
ncbi:MAG: hypothetical protein P8Y58_17705 [Novosphingobium sp.]